MRVVMEPGWRENVLAATDALFADRLGPAIAGDAARFAPKDTGELAASVEHHLEGHTLIVSATGGAGGRVYAAWVELGHRVFHPSTGKVGPQVVPPEPFLKPALFMARGD